jgi:hypothetical protein
VYNPGACSNSFKSFELGYALCADGVAGFGAISFTPSPHVAIGANRTSHGGGTLTGGGEGCGSAGASITSRRSDRHGG